MTRFFTPKTMRSFIFDTSFLVSLLDINDSNHVKAIEAISGLEIWKLYTRFYVNDTIINETLTVLNYKLWFPFIEKFEQLLNGLEVIYISGNNEEYISFFKSLIWKVSVADTSVIYDSLKHNLDILCFDKQIISIHSKLSK
jgi:predicted nucleic acid-binding protein